MLAASMGGARELTNAATNSKSDEKSRGTAVCGVGPPVAMGLVHSTLEPSR